MEEYYQAKAQLFDLTKEYSVVNIDDEYGRRLIDHLYTHSKKVLTYGIDSKADVYATDIVYSVDSSTYVLHTPAGSTKITVNIPGLIYVYNSLAAIACAHCHDISLVHIQQGIVMCKGLREDWKLCMRMKITESL